IIPLDLAPSDAFMASLSDVEKLDVWHVCLLTYLLTIEGKSIVPHEFQLQGLLAMMKGKDSIVYSGCGTGKTLLMVLPILWNIKACFIIISPLK
ncbi:hypothetical protein NEOLEDRAFT_1024209, partial [Neolentinus lepideus HHB14362 ss-1]